MVSKRLIHEEGHKRKFLAIVDASPECDRAVLYAATRAEHSGGALTLLYVITPGDFQHWIGVENIMRAEAAAEAENQLAKQSQYVRDAANIEPELVTREGTVVGEIEKLIEEDRDISIMVLAAGDASEGPGPLVSSIAGKGAVFPIPVVVVPCNLSDEDIRSLS